VKSEPKQKPAPPADNLKKAKIELENILTLLKRG